MIGPSTESRSAVDRPRQVLEKAQAGIGLSLLATGLTLPASALLYLLLGRMGPEILGFFALASLLTGLLMTFGFFGDSLVYVKFIPQLGDRERIPFVLAHGLLILIQGGLLLSCLWFFPKTLTLLLGAQAGGLLALFAVLLAPLVWGQGICSSLLQALLDTGWQSFGLRIPSIVSLTAVMACVLIWPSVFAEHYRPALLGILLAANGAGLSVLAWRAWQVFFARSSIAWRLSFPEGFWRFTIFLQLGTLAAFAFQNLDQLITAGALPLAALGRYKAVVSFAELVRIAPAVVATTTYPALVHLKQADPDRRAAGSFRRAMFDMVFLFSVAVAVITATLGPELLGVLFGRSYSSEAVPLAVLSVGYCLSGISLLASAELISHGRSDLILVAQLIASLAQLLVSMLMVPALGLLGVVIGRVLSIAVHAGLTCYWAGTVSRLLAGRIFLLGLAIAGPVAFPAALHLPLLFRGLWAGCAEACLLPLALQWWRQCSEWGPNPFTAFWGRRWPLGKGVHGISPGD